MKVDFAFLCDYAEANGPKLHAGGIGFDTIYCQKVPAQHPQFFMVAQLRASAFEAGAKKLVVGLIDEDGGALVQQEGQLEMPKPVPGQKETTARIAMGFVMTQFPRFGSYSLHLAVNGTEMVCLPLRIVKIPNVASPN